MIPDKQVKKEFKLKASIEPDKYYATSILKKEGFIRKQCKCGTFFWTTNSDRPFCGDPSCSGGFDFFEGTPAKNKYDYIEVWNEFARLFTKWGYTPIKRYPVTARWRDDTDFVQASIYNFQPYVVSGEVEPPANPLVVPQFCLRFNDVDNVGITGAHYTGFVMIGQHAFMPEDKWDQNKFFSDIHNWLKVGLGLPNNEITFHEDAWAGGGNFGPCMEYFSRGLELGNQVYMLFEQTPSGPKPLKLKVLDMGMGHERNAWFTKGTSTSYETTFPTVCNKLYKSTGIKVDQDLMKRFLPYSSFLNVDEVDDIGKVWLDVAKKVHEDVNTLKKKVLPLAALYSVGEHSRSLLFALSDGALPSNVGGGYNLRVILRRALSFIEQYGWDIDLADLCDLHAEYLKPIFPEVSDNLDNVKKILDEEKKKFNATREKSKQIISKIEEKISETELLKLYDSQGISPELIREEAAKIGKKIFIPDNFYAKVNELHEKKEQVHATEKQDKLNLDNVPLTESIYFDDYTHHKFKGKVIKIIENKVILDKSAFYPTSGGQLHDEGTLNCNKVIDVFKQGNVIIHAMDKINFNEGDILEGNIDIERRKQLSQHHTSTHIVNFAAKHVLGNHINQAGAKKTKEKATLDITHYKAISEEELKKIEEEANNIVDKKIPIIKKFYSRTDAEKKFGMAIYQGGAVPGKNLRIVEIPGVDVEACGGTHLNNTGEAGKIKIQSSTKIQDGIVRLTFTAGYATECADKVCDNVILNTAAILGVEPNQVPGRVEELFIKWKQANKAIKNKKIFTKEDFELKSDAIFNGDILQKTAEILRTQPEHIIKTVNRFLSVLEEIKRKNIK